MKKVEIKIEKFKCVVAKEHWFTMLRNKFWSTFSYFSQDELEEGI